jgi:single stranded DNA-binding protein
MSDMNICLFEGNLTKDPVVRTVPGKNGDVSVVNFTIAVNTRFGKQEKTTYINCEAWDKGADVIAKHFHKSKAIRVQAEHVTDKYEKDGQTVYREKFRVKEFFFVNRGKSEDGEGQEEPVVEEPTPAPAAAKTTTRATTTKTTGKRNQPPVEENDDQDIPF